ncbi:hypothetical protein FE257_005092 [Aspergillus nanangensis]|uniref:Uncharacterized protein n=1 Tax=Aspergillus nanangensis TaxID=2582783 RepID=A0AAD4CRC5_ASPNN|nr:hypothetical protein FE257_005092 [Aspergillus nanangensis]
MEDVRPTAKWANRILRPLSSIYHRLEKHHDILTSIAVARSKETSEIRSRTGQTQLETTIGAEGHHSYSDEEPGDPAWVPGKADKRRIRHNYASRGQRNGVNKRSRMSIRSPERQKTLPGAIEIATPLITGKTSGCLEPSSLRKQLFQSPLSLANHAAPSEQRRASRTNNPSFPAYQGSWKEVLDLSGDTGLADIAHSLDRTFIKFLDKTRVSPKCLDNGRAGHGARSLLSMTMRCLPGFIAEEQKIQDGLDEHGQVDMCDAYFTELEANYAPSGSGWKPLREAVRAQGIHLVSELMQNEWITKLAACRIMEECIDHGELDAFEKLMSRYLGIVNTYEYPVAFESHKPTGHCDDPIQMLGKYYSRNRGNRSFVFEELATLLVRGSVPPEWMVTAMWKRCMDGAIKSLSVEDGDSASATRLVKAVISSASGLSLPRKTYLSLMEEGPGRVQRKPSRDTCASTNPTSLRKGQLPCPVPIQNALSNLVCSLVTALCGISIARSQAPAKDVRATGVKVRNTVESLALAVQQAIGLAPAYEIGEPTLCSLRRGYVLLGDLMMRCGEQSSLDVIGQVDALSVRNIQLFFQSLASQHDTVKELAELVQQVFRCCGHVGKDEDARTPRAVRDKVSQLAQLTDIQGVSRFLGNVAAETAMGFAEMTLDTYDHAWAIEVQEMVVSLQSSQGSKQSLSSSPISADNNTGLYQWEESIGEWVASTPMPKLKGVRVTDASKQAIARPCLPSTIACSTSSSAPSLSEEDAVSSVTSSAPSIPTKRACVDGVYVSRPWKKLRLNSVEVCRSNPGRFDQSPSRASSPEADLAPIAARTRAARGTLTELPQAKSFSRNPFSAQESNPTSKVEVVIINQKNLSSPGNEASEYVSEPISVRTRLGKSLSLQSRWENSQKTSPAPFTQSAMRMRPVIPCSEDDDSDDELSFL